MLRFLHHCFFFFFFILRSWLQKECKEKRRNKEEEKLRFERFVKKRMGFPILLGLSYIFNFLVFFVCGVLQMRKKLV